MSATTPAPSPKKKKNKGNRHVYITERIRYLKFDVPSVDTVIEEDKWTKKLHAAGEAGDWRAQAHALVKLGQLMKWKGKIEIGEEYLARSAAILRDHTFMDDEDDGVWDQ